MSLVTIHGPYTMYMQGGGGVTASVPPGARATVNPTNGLIVTFTCEGSRPSGDLTWAFGSGASPATGNGVGPIVVTYSGPGTKAVTLTVAGAGAPPPANGVLNMSVVVAGGTLRSVPHDVPEASQQSAEPEPEVDVDVGYDPAAHTVDEVVEFAEAHPDQVDEILAAEQAGKNRSTLTSHLEHMQS